MLNHDGTDAEVWNPPSHAPIPLVGGGEGGAPTISDFDGDGVPEIGIASAAAYTVYEADGSVRWSSAISDYSSNSTSSTTFDFDQDGSVEVIYRDERFLRIYRGSDGLLLYKRQMASSTWIEEPVVADLDNDGHAELVVCADNGLGGGSIIDTGITIFEDVADHWGRTRRIWNQNAYHITNVSEDGAVPAVEPANWLTAGLDNFRLNTPAPGDDQADSFVYRASDGTLDSNDAIVRIAIRQPNSAPDIRSAAPLAAAVGVHYGYAVAAIDPDVGDTLTFSLPAAPQGMTIAAATGLIDWTPSAAQTGANSVIVKVTDARGFFDLQGYTATVGTAIAVPNVVGQPESSARSTIAAAGLSTGNVSTQNNTTTPAGNVISQAPTAGSLVATSTAVNLIVSLGPSPADRDDDGDGLSESQGDCNDANAAIHPGAVDIPGNGIDEDCSGADATDSAALDNDGDGFSAAQGDCNDANPAIHPGAVDVPATASMRTATDATRSAETMTRRLLQSSYRRRTRF